MRSKKEIEDSIKKNWNETPGKGILSEEIRLRMWKNIEKATIRRKKRTYRWIAAACIAFLLSVAGYQSLFYTSFSSSKTIVSTKTFPQDIRLLRLPDGSRIWVNQNTEIEYPEQFASNERVISLKGEAFFEVARDTLRPFIITSGEIRTTVLGTSFNVKAYKGIAPEVHVRSGKVKVESSQNTVYLEKGFAGIFNAGSKKINKQKSGILEPEWKKTLLDVDGITLEQVIEKLQPIQPFIVKYTDDNLKNLRIKGTLDTRHGLAEVLKTLSFALGLEINPVDNGTYSISKLKI